MHHTLKLLRYPNTLKQTFWFEFWDIHQYIWTHNWWNIWRLSACKYLDSLSPRFLDRYASRYLKTSRQVGVWRLSQVLHTTLNPFFWPAPDWGKTSHEKKRFFSSAIARIRGWGGLCPNLLALCPPRNSLRISEFLVKSHDICKSFWSFFSLLLSLPL